MRGELRDKEVAGELKKMDKQGIKVIVSSQRQAFQKELTKFDKKRFRYGRENDCYKRLFILLRKDKPGV